MRIALIGATGLVGSQAVQRLTAHDLLVLTRRPTGLGVPEVGAPAEDWPKLVRARAVDVAISALGTTWRKAGSWDSFEQIDRHFVVEFAKAARDAGARQMITVSAVGADPNSINGYLAVKGRAEQDLESLAFERLDVLRPGLLRGQRGSERRLKERLGILVSPLVNLFLRGPLDRFAAIDAETVACAVAELVSVSGTGVHVHHNRDIAAVAGR